jgi:polyisoprenoid-binding protein YceI
MRKQTFQTECILAAVSAVLFFVPFSHADSSAYVLDIGGGKGDVSFRAIAKPGSVKINGTGATPTGKFNLSAGSKADAVQVTGVSEFDLTSLDTGIGLRTEHMKKKYLQTDQFPKASLKITSIGIPSAKLGQEINEDKASFDGILTLHGKDGPVHGTMEIHGKPAQWDMTTHFDLKLTDFSIEVPTFMGITVNDQVDVTVHTVSGLSSAAISK